MQRILISTGVVLGALVLGAGDCGPTEEYGCSHDAECAAGQYCRDADGQCYELGSCYDASDCDEQNLNHIMCVGEWSCRSNSCAYTCGTISAPGMGETCGSDDACAAGLECVHYYGIAGPSGPEFRSCEKRCSTSTDCGTNASCVTIADGPGSVCRVREG